jgi:hypothetical protein
MNMKEKAFVVFRFELIIRANSTKIVLRLETVISIEDIWCPKARINKFLYICVNSTNSSS